MKRFFVTALAICGILFSSYSLANPPVFYTGSDKESFQKFKSRYLEILMEGDEVRAALAMASNGCWAASLAEYGVVGIVKNTARTTCWSYCKKKCKVVDTNGNSSFVKNFRVPSSESKSLIWCATVSLVNRITGSSCNSRNGSEYSTEYLAKVLNLVGPESTQAN